MNQDQIFRELLDRFLDHYSPHPDELLMMHGFLFDDQPLVGSLHDEMTTTILYLKEEQQAHQLTHLQDLVNHFDRKRAQMRAFLERVIAETAKEELPEIIYDFAIPDDMQAIINESAIGLGAAGAVHGLQGPGVDLVVIGPVWIGMTMRLAEKAGQNISMQTAKSIAFAACAGAGTFIGGAKAASTVIGWLTAPFILGASLLKSAATTAALNATLTKSYGNALARYFLQTDEIGEPDAVVKIILGLVRKDLGAQVNKM